jgi:hypothetical protein
LGSCDEVYSIQEENARTSFEDYSAPVVKLTRFDVATMNWVFFFNRHLQGLSHTIDFNFQGIITSRFSARLMPLLAKRPSQSGQSRQFSSLTVVSHTRMLQHITPTAGPRMTILSSLNQSSCRLSWKSFSIQTAIWTNCDFGSPCNCSECRDAMKKPACEIYQVHPTAYQTSNYYHDRKGIPSYSFFSFCEQCYEKATMDQKKRDDEVNRILSAREVKKEEMIAQLMVLNCSERVPIRYAVEKMLVEMQTVKRLIPNSPQWHRRHLVTTLSQELNILKVANRYVGSRKRVDAMDFRLW